MEKDLKYVVLLMILYYFQILLHREAVSNYISSYQVYVVNGDN